MAATSLSDLIGRATTMRLWIRSRFPVRFEYQVWRKGAGDVPAMSLEREEFAHSCET
jgi:hypothetical protein